ncbi:hypothetical protein BD324DRAFT_637852 [Kockovaella imperatae]|uniref:Uncharacterized protein n=1 Tax=Kockovaella imperatae TaxID=4999 RepID=A0A1Y1U7I0_9TREE|nr:hypothetical protein BD324DRAFT_637852 [Kockovaella imperatae]ORX33973.1 hypothetical protein BD324DRAFT_637852 [Kockovaella imperatae]
MCHTSPAASVLSLFVTVIGAIFVAWHIRSFDGGKCLLFTRRDAFRWGRSVRGRQGITDWSSDIDDVDGVAGLRGFAGQSIWLNVKFLTWCGIITWIKYQEAYGVIPVGPDEVEILPVPFQLWSATRQTLMRNGYHVMSVGWALMLAVHGEETLYWGYLINAIRSRNNESWFKSIYFKLWVAGSLAVICIMPAAGSIETKNIVKMENNIFLAGSVVAIINFVSSLWLIVVFPGFINESRKQGANPEVLGRLHYFKELNLARTVFRLLYSATLMALSVDGYTKHAFLNTTPFWTDCLFVSAYFSAFISTCISLMILLPRSMTSEAGMGRTTAPVFVRQPAGPFGVRKVRRDDGASIRPRDLERQSNPWGALGERLNLDRADLEDLAESHSSADAFDLPFAAQPGSRMLRDGEEPKQNLPGQLKDFRGPLDVNRPQEPMDLNIVVTSTTVVDK